MTNEKFYEFILGSCSLTPSSDLKLYFSGSVTVKQPSGYLNAAEYPFIPVSVQTHTHTHTNGTIIIISMCSHVQFYSYMSLSYFAVGAIWLMLCMLYRKDVMQVQNCISCVLVMCLIEMLAWFFYYDTYNRVGIRPIAPFFVALLSSVVRKAVSRVGLLCV